MSKDEQHEVAAPVAAPAAAASAKPAGKSKVPMIVGVVLALLVVRWMFSGPSKTTASGSGADPSSASAAATADAPAADAGGNPVIGEWALVDPADAAYCPTYQKFTASKSTYTQNGQTVTATPIYDVKPGVTVVGYGGSYMAEWRPTGPDDMTLGQVGPPPYGVPSFCKYHRQ